MGGGGWGAVTTAGGADPKTTGGLIMKALRRFGGAGAMDLAAGGGEGERDSPTRTITGGTA
jgi:hypothetical protein